MAKRIVMIAVMTAFVVCTVAVAQQWKAIGESRFGAVEIRRTQPQFIRSGGTLAIPWHVNYQGYLTDDAGNPINDTLSMTFGIWDAASVGTELWNENGNVVVEEGLFNVVLGSTTPIPSDVFGAGLSRWLELTVVAQTLSPRTEITSVGYAYRAVRADSSDDADRVDGFDASATPGANDLFPLSAGDVQYVNEGQVDAIDSPMIVDGTILRADADAAFKAPYADTADYALNAPTDNDWTIAGNDMYSAVSGNVGIGTSPTERLDVDGTVQMTGFSLPIGATSGYVLTSDVSGLGTWQVAAADNDWTITGNVLHPSGDYGLAMRSSNVLYGTNDSTHVNLGVACTTGTSGENYKYCTVSGGYRNQATTFYATVGGGNGNSAGGLYATIGGGEGNEADGSRSTVGGGNNNSVTGVLGTIGGGLGNTITAYAGAVAGGVDHRITSSGGAVGGGRWNSVTGSYGTVAGGERNSVSGSHAAVAGGDSVTVAGDYSFAAGNRVDVTPTANYTFAFGRDFSTWTPNAVVFHNSVDPVRVGIGVPNPITYLQIAGGAYCDGTNWVNASSREYKRDIRSLSPEEYRDILEKLGETEVVRFRYEKQEDNKLHIGIIAEDAPEEMVDALRTGIPTGDAIGFLMAAVKAQQETIELQQKEIASIRKKIQAMDGDDTRY